MSHQQLPFRAETREKPLRGAVAPADAIRVSLGLKSKRVLSDKERGKSIACTDAVTIGKAQRAVVNKDNATIIGGAGKKFDAAFGKCVDLLEAVIINPAEFFRLTLENAVSVAAALFVDRSRANGSAGTQSRSGPHGRTSGRTTP